LKLAVFLADLGSSRGAPGGGAAAALVGAAGAALVEMTSRLNDKRLKNSSGSAAKASVLRARLFKLITEDASAFKKIQALWPKRKEKPSDWQAALKNGAAVPMRICQASWEGSRLADAEKSRTGRWLESDRKEARILFRAAFDSAKLNVEINLKEMTDASFKKRVRREMRLWRQNL
jgi:methenyltetrahydrofolate cyclohydrolase